MSLASEVSGDSALVRIQDRVTAYWDCQVEKRVISTLVDVLASNVANIASDMVAGTALFCGPAASNGSGQTVLPSRVNVGIHPLGYSLLLVSMALQGAYCPRRVAPYIVPRRGSFAVEFFLFEGVHALVESL
jgi:hypothetical protein